MDGAAGRTAADENATRGVLRQFFEAVAPNLAAEEKLDALAASFRRRAEQQRATYPASKAPAAGEWPENAFIAIKRRRGIDPRELCNHIRGELAWQSLPSSLPAAGDAPPSAPVRRRRVYTIAKAAAAVEVPPEPAAAGRRCRYFCVVGKEPVATAPGELQTHGGQRVGSRTAQQLGAGTVTRVHQVTEDGDALTVSRLPDLHPRHAVPALRISVSRPVLSRWCDRTPGGPRYSTAQLGPSSCARSRAGRSRSLSRSLSLSPSPSPSPPASAS